MRLELLAIIIVVGIDGRGDDRITKTAARHASFVGDAYLLLTHLYLLFQAVLCHVVLMMVMDLMEC